MPSRTADQLKTFNIFLTFNPLLKRLFLLHIDNQFIKFLVNCVFNVVRGNVKITTTTTTTTTTANTTEESAVANYQNVARKKLSKFRKVISKLCCRKVALSEKRKIFASPEGIRLLILLHVSVRSHLEGTIEQQEEEENDGVSTRV